MAAPQSRAIGTGSAIRSSQFMIIPEAHSLGSKLLVGVFSTDQVVHEVLEPLRPRQLLRPHEAQEHDQHADRARAQQAQQLAGTPGRKDVHQQHGDDGPQRRRGGSGTG